MQRISLGRSTKSTPVREFHQASGKDAGVHQSSRFIQAEHDVHVLHGAACLPFDEVVDVADDDQLAGSVIDVEAQVAEIAAAHVDAALGLVGAEDSDEDVFSVKGSIGVEDLWKALSGLQTAVDGGKDPSTEGDDMGCEGEGDRCAGQKPQLSFDLVDVLVSGDPVSVHGLIACRVVEGGRGLFPRSGHACLGVADDALQVDQALFDGGGQAQDAADRKTAGVSHEIRPGDPVAVELRQTVDALGQNIRRCMGLGPSDPGGISCIRVWVVEAEIAAVIDDLGAFTEPLRAFLLTDAVRRGEKDHIEVFGQLGVLRTAQREVAEAGQMGVEVADRLADVLLVDQGRDLDFGVAVEELYGTTAAVPAGADDAYLDLFHGKRPHKGFNGSDRRGRPPGHPDNSGLCRSRRG
ncbi:hypothetical protein TRIP_B200445 [uncultured Desulfatiglans sp.]|nr:hypothetical protein TRIP_B200445 [uncultured Desulfatiglans sp.]